jgi:GNAT superfamily N-acetyltransferase
MAIDPKEVIAHDTKASPGQASAYKENDFAGHTITKQKVALKDLHHNAYGMDWNPTKPMHDEGEKHSYEKVKSDPHYVSDDESYARQYSQLKTPAPHIIVKQDGDKFKIMSGRHRARAAHLRGETHIDAYVATPNLKKSEYLSKATKTYSTKAVAKHWHETAYPGEKYSDKEHYENMVEHHHDGKWEKKDIPVGDIEGHHKGHDATHEDIPHYAKQRQAGSEFPPIIVEHHPDKPGKFKTVDGMHRHAAAASIGQKTISAYVPVTPLKKTMSIGHNLSAPAESTGGAALAAESFGKLKNKLKKKKNDKLSEEIAELEKIEALVKASDDEHPFIQKARITVIGKTKSGKAIYQHPGADFHAEFDENDHYDAAECHKGIVSKLDKMIKDNPKQDKEWTHRLPQHSKYSTMCSATHIAIGNLHKDFKKSEEIEVLAKGKHGDWHQEGYTLKHKVDQPKGFPKSDFLHTVDVYHPDHGHVASGEFVENKKEKTVQASTVGVHKDHQRKGIATAMYQSIESKTGLKAIRGDDQSPSAAKFWRGAGYDKKEFGREDQFSRHKIFKSELSKGRFKELLQDAEEILQKMSRPVLNFPNFKKLNTRPDQEVRLVENNKQKDMYGHVLANAAIPDQAVRHSTFNTDTMQSGPTEVRKQNNQPIRDKEAKKISGAFDRTTVGLNADTKQGPKSAALAGKLRSKFEEPDDAHSTKLKEHNEARNKMVTEYNEHYKTWYKKAYELSNKLDEPGGREAYAHHVGLKPTKPKLPRKPSLKSKETTSLTPQQAIARNRSVDATIQHEAFHHTMDQFEHNYGAKAAHIVQMKMLEQYDPTALKAVGSYIANRLNYKPKSKHFAEEIMAHTRDILVNPKKRESFKQFVGEANYDKYIKAMKISHNKAAQFTKNLKPEDLGIKDESLTKGEESSYKADHVLAHMHSSELGDPSARINSKVTAHPQWELKNIPVDKIHNHAGPVSKPMTGDEFGESDESVAQEYSEKTTTAPHIVIQPHPTLPGHYQTIDGAHRARAAFLSGKKEVSAYVPLNLSNKK